MISPDDLRQLCAQIRKEHAAGVQSNPFDLEGLLGLVELAEPHLVLHRLNDNERAIFDFKLPAFVRAFLAIRSLPATETISIDDAGYMPKLYALWSGIPICVTMVSRLGDVGISLKDQRHGYERRVSIYELESFSQKPLPPRTVEDGA